MDSKEVPSRKYTVQVQIRTEGAGTIQGKWSKYKYHPQKEQEERMQHQRNENPRRNESFFRSQSANNEHG